MWPKFVPITCVNLDGTTAVVYASGEIHAYVSKQTSKS